MEVGPPHALEQRVEAQDPLPVIASPEAGIQRLKDEEAKGGDRQTEEVKHPQGSIENATLPEGPPAAPKDGSPEPQQYALSLHQSLSPLNEASLSMSLVFYFM